jgi:hypothetical protein
VAETDKREGEAMNEEQPICEEDCGKPCSPNKYCDECNAYWERMRREGYWDDVSGWTPDWMAETILELREENSRLKAEIAKWNWTLPEPRKDSIDRIHEAENERLKAEIADKDAWKDRVEKI